MRIFSSVECLRRVLRRISRTTFSVGSFELIDFCLIFVPFGHYDELEILPCENPSIRPKGADGRHGVGGGRRCQKGRTGRCQDSLFQ